MPVMVGLPLIMSGTGSGSEVISRPLTHISGGQTSSSADPEKAKGASCRIDLSLCVNSLIGSLQTW